MKIVDKLYYQLDIRLLDYKKYIFDLVGSVLDFIEPASPFDDVVREAFIDRLAEEGDLQYSRLELDWSYTDMNELVEVYLKRKCVNSYLQ